MARKQEVLVFMEINPVLINIGQRVNQWLCSHKVELRFWYLHKQRPCTNLKADCYWPYCIKSKHGRWNPRSREQQILAIYFAYCIWCTHSQKFDDISDCLPKNCQLAGWHLQVMLPNLLFGNSRATWLGISSFFFCDLLVMLPNLLFSWSGNLTSD